MSSVQQPVLLRRCCGRDRACAFWQPAASRCEQRAKAAAPPARSRRRLVEHCGGRIGMADRAKSRHWHLFMRDIEIGPTRVRLRSTREEKQRSHRCPVVQADLTAVSGIVCPSHRLTLGADQHHRDDPAGQHDDAADHVEGYYNRVRIHSAIGYITPQQAEAAAA